MPLTTAMLCNAAIGVKPSSRPCMMATVAFSTVSSDFGAMPELTTTLARRNTPSISCGTMAAIRPPPTSGGLGARGAAGTFVATSAAVLVSVTLLSPLLKGNFRLERLRHLRQHDSLSLQGARVDGG